MDPNLQRRLKLHEILLGMGTSYAYFQPPATVAMKYPCIVYNLDDIDTKFADNVPYRLRRRYQVTVIDRDPDSKIPANVAALPTCTFNRFFVEDNLNHFVFTLYF